MPRWLRSTLCVVIAATLQSGGFTSRTESTSGTPGLRSKLRDEELAQLRGMVAKFKEILGPLGSTS